MDGPCMQGSEWPSTSQAILCQWHSTFSTTNNCAIFQVIENGAYVKDLHCCAVILVSSVVLRMSLLLLILKKKAPIPRKDAGRTHTETFVQQNWLFVMSAEKEVTLLRFVEVRTCRRLPLLRKVLNSLLESQEHIQVLTSI